MIEQGTERNRTRNGPEPDKERTGTGPEPDKERTGTGREPDGNKEEPEPMNRFEIILVGVGLGALAGAGLSLLLVLLSLVWPELLLWASVPAIAGTLIGGMAAARDD
jgi:hypothetical protein